ncbi:MAG TPA: MerR family transcriptional regulator [Rhodospirillaceae bacterium]|nr:MerR family transcriptional regulator [Rhodospirillaceae bacterium]
MKPGSALSVDLLESEIGLSREVVRKWEIRYGFPCPDRDDSGARIYPADQVVQLRLIGRLVRSGARPSKVVGLDLLTLERLTEESLAPEALPSVFSRLILETLLKHDLPQLKLLLRGQLHRDGLAHFVYETVARLNHVVGEAWLRGEIRVFEEHLYTETISDILSDALRTVTLPSGSPRFLLSTPPGELHTLGLLMVLTMAVLEGAYCINLGSQTPAGEMVRAAQALQIDLVGISLSIAHPAREAAAYLRDLRDQLDPKIEIWAGGEGVLSLRRIAGVRVFRNLESLGGAVRSWRASRIRSVKSSPG